MAGNSSKRSPWGLRLGILGALLLLGGGIALSSQTSAIDSIYDPRERATVEIVVGQSAIVEVGNDECYMAVAFSNASESEVEIKKMVGVLLSMRPWKLKIVLQTGHQWRLTEPVLWWLKNG